MALAPSTATGTIYDIGYRNYEGARLGRAYAFRTLFVHSLRSAFGLVRGGKALLFPVFIFAFVLLPAIVQTAVGALSGGEVQLVDYDDYFQGVVMLITLFVAVQAPELVSRDQHHRVLPLYFTRPLRTHDYASAKLLAMLTSVLILMLSPQLVIFLGRVGLASDTGAALRTEGRFVLPILASVLIVAGVMGGLALAIAAFTPRRGVATAVVFGFFLITGAVTNIVSEAARGDVQRFAPLFNPVIVAHGSILALFNEDPDRGSMLARADLPPAALFTAAAVLFLLATLALYGRYARIRV